MMRAATAADVPALRGFLEQHVETSMFLLGNLEAHGVSGSDHPKATRYFLWEEAGQITGVFGSTPDGDLMCQMPAITPAAAEAFVRALSGQRVCGITGVGAQVEEVLRALALPQERWQMDEVEPLYQLSLDALPEGREVLRVPQPEDRAMLEAWYLAYHLDTGAGLWCRGRHRGGAAGQGGGELIAPRALDRERQTRGDIAIHCPSRGGGADRWRLRAGTAARAGPGRPGGGGAAASAA